MKDVPPEPIPPSVRPVRVDKAGRLTLPREIRDALRTVIGGVYGWFDGRRFHVASWEDLQADMDARTRAARAAHKRRKQRASTKRPAARAP